MKLWLLRPKDGEEDNAWKPWHDKTFGFVIRAESEKRARQIASDNGGDELRDGVRKAGADPWLDVAQSTCEELTNDGPEELVLRDFAAA